MKTNTELQADVQNAIKWEPLIYAAEIGVTAKDRAVSLTGTGGQREKFFLRHFFYHIMGKSHCILTLVFAVMAVSAIAQKLETVPYVDLTKYAGKWYEIASFPQRFQKGCHCTTAEYSLTDKGFVVVENRCDKDSINGPQSYIKGKAFVVQNSGNAKLKVQFFWPFKGKYWIIDLADGYSYAVVGHPSRKYLWILSRTPSMDEDTYKQLVSRLAEKGFNVTKIKRTQQI